MKHKKFFYEWGHELKYSTQNLCKQKKQEKSIGGAYS